MDKNQRTVLAFIFGPSFLIPEDYIGLNLPWKSFKRAVRFEIDFRRSQPNYWGAKSHNKDALPLVGNLGTVVPFRTSTKTNTKLNL